MVVWVAASEALQLQVDGYNFGATTWDMKRLSFAVHLNFVFKWNWWPAGLFQGWDEPATTSQITVGEDDLGSYIKTEAPGSNNAARKVME